ncbi:MAG TPA: NAD(P)H-hydrate epimerase, partial [Bacteroidia bacterium]|nr:NAD(P)H-hydrate epimerase [Bacteroidia bacterium]
MKILSQSQIREADEFTISHEPIASIDLMERAAGECSDWIVKNYGKEFLCLFICGNGNNGGDGLAIARQLSEKGFSVEIYILKVSSTDSADFSVNLKRLSENKIPFKIISDADEIIFRG